MTAALPSPLPLPLCRVLTIITFHERDDDKAAAARRGGLPAYLPNRVTQR